MRTVAEWMDTAEAAYTAFKKARNDYANAKADYEFKRLNVKAKSEEKSEAARNGEAEIAARVERVALIRAEGALDIAESWLKTCQSELVAAQSVQKYAGALDGGGGRGDTWGDW